MNSSMHVKCYSQEDKGVCVRNVRGSEEGVKLYCVEEGESARKISQKRFFRSV